MKKCYFLTLLYFLCINYFSISQETSENPFDRTDIDQELINEKLEDSLHKKQQWYFQNINIVKSGATRYGPSKIGDLYLEYEFFGRKGFLDFYGYLDFPKFFGTATSGYKGIWDGGSVLFIELQPRISINSLSKKDLSFLIFKELYLSFNYVGDWGKRKNFAKANNLFLGVGTDIDTHTPLSLAVNFYVRKVWDNYGAPNENSWDGFRLKFKTILPLTKVGKGNLAYITFGDYDFGSKLGRYDNRTYNAFVLSQVLNLSFKHYHFSVVGRYFSQGGQFRYENADFSIYSNGGWGYYLAAGISF